MSLIELVRSAMGSWPEPAQEGASVRVPTHCLYPSNSIVSVFVEGRETFLVHDNAGALDEMEAATAVVPNAFRLIANVARPHGLRISDRGAIFAAQVTWEGLSAAVVTVANASADAAFNLLGAHRPPRRDIRQALEHILEQDFPSLWQREVRIIGASNKPHRFDYVVRLRNDRQLLLDTVVPEASSINAAVVAHLDVRQSDVNKFEQRIIFDDEVAWSSSDLSLLRVGANPVPFSLVRDALGKIAA